MADMAKLYIFGDNTYETNAKLLSLLHVAGDPILAAFFDQAFDVIRTESAGLPIDEFRNLPSFTSLAEIVAKHKEGLLGPAFQIALTTTYHLGAFIRQHGTSGREYPSSSNSYLLGICTGALSAIAISCCRTLSQLLPVAVEAVRIAFRTGLCASILGNQIEPISNASWSLILPGMKAEAVEIILRDFSASKNLPPVSRPWVSAHIENGTSISGPPKVLDQLKEFPAFSKARTVEIPSRTPGHASHLFTEEDFEFVLKNTPDSPWNSYICQIPIFSPATGKVLVGTSFKSFLKISVAETMAQKLRWDLINQEMPVAFAARNIAHLTLIPIGTTSEHALLSTLQSNIHSVEIEHLDTPHIESYINKSGNPSLSKLAIVGMSGRFPEADSPEEFWEVLRTGRNTVGKVPKKLWDIATHCDPNGKRNTGNVPWGCFLRDVAQFDARFFSISPKEAPQVDPAQRLVLMASYEAMEQAGLVPDSTPSTKRDRIGVFSGATGNDYLESNTSQDVDTHFVTGGNRAFIPGRVSFCFEFNGPTACIDSACSSSLTAMHAACNSLWRGDCDTVLSCGTNMISNPDGHAGLDRGFFLSKTGNCKTFDDSADGYCRGEAITTVIIKRLEDALADKDPILALIDGILTNHSGETDSITRPYAPAQKAIFEKLLTATGTDMNEVSYIEMHGTGTQVGDAVEMESVLHSFAPTSAGPQARRKDAPLYIGAAKANVGHGEGASGITSLVKVLLMLRNNSIPPHCGITTKINHTYPLDLNQRNIHIASKEVAWHGSPSRPRKIIINNFSAAGGNTALLVQDPPPQIIDYSRDPSPPTSYIVTVTAKCANSLKGNAKSMLHYIATQGSDSLLPQLSYTTTARRVHYQHRIIVRGSSIKEVQTKLEEAIARRDGLTRQKITPKVVFAFTGQGSQYPGMGKQLYESFSHFRDDILRFDRIAQSQGFQSFREIFSESTTSLNEFSPQVIQLAICSLEMALARLWISWDVRPEVVVGHSLGEYAALNIAGVISDSDTIYLVGKRAELLQQQCRAGSHAMLSVKASVPRLGELLSGQKYEISCINGPEDTVIGGPVTQIKSIEELLAAHHVKATPLHIPYAFHTSQVFSMLGDFQAAASGVTFSKPSLPVICPLLGNVITDVGTFGANYLSRHCRETVDVLAAFTFAKNANLISDKCIFIEIGPQPTVSGMIKNCLGSKTATLHTLQKGQDSYPLITAALSALYTSSHNICWLEYHRDFKAAQKVLRLPAYSWDLKQYWIPYMNDWSLTKGTLPPMPIYQAPPSFESTSIHKVVEESVTAAGVSIIVESDVSREDFNAVVKGHRVDNIPLTTPSVYAEIALSIGKVLTKKYQPSIKDFIIDVADLVVEKALIPHSNGPQILRTSGNMNWTTKHGHMRFDSVNSAGKVVVEHGHCSIILKTREELDKIKLDLPHYLDRLEYLRKEATAGNILRLKKLYAYKLVSSLASFHPDYIAADEVTLDSRTLEACATCSFGSVVSTGNFSTHPVYIDVMTQTAGFVLNAKDTTDLTVEVFVNHGWQSLQIFEEITTDKSYVTYVKMVQDGEFWRGDTIMLEGQTVVAFFKGVTLRSIPRRAFHLVLNAASPQKGKTAKPTPVPQATVAVPAIKEAHDATSNPAPPKIATAIKKAVPAPTKDQLSVSLPAPPVKAPEPVPVVQKPQPVKDAVANGQLTRALSIISEETGIALDDLTDDSNFTEIGVDSLLSMVITSRFREELGLDLDLEFSLFLDLPTVNDLKEFINPSCKRASSDKVIEETADKVREKAADESLSESSDSSERNETSYQTTSSTSSLGDLVKVDVVVDHIEVEDHHDEHGDAARFQAAMDEHFGPALRIVAEESGLDIADLTEDTNFAEIGVDSLLSMVITSRFREELGLDLDLEFSLFLDLPTVKDLQKFLVPETAQPPTSSAAPSSSSWDSAGALTPGNSLNDGFDVSLDQMESRPRESCYCRPATSVILQGLPDRTQKTLFLFPDGGGSSSSYEPLPKLKNDASIIGLNCPYVRDPENMLCNIHDLMDSYVAEIRRRQAHGPYHLGGWSAGGIFAYLATKMFIADGEEVLSLLIIDSPVPGLMDKLPTHFYEYCDQLGLFGYSMGNENEETPEWLIPHFNATVDVMRGHRVDPLDIPEGKRPKVSLIWACDNILDDCKADWVDQLNDSKGMHFLVQKRTDFGPCGWEKMLPGVDINCDKVIGANHFSMMHKPFIDYVGKFLERGID